MENGHTIARKEIHDTIYAMKVLKVKKRFLFFFRRSIKR